MNNLLSPHVILSISLSLSLSVCLSFTLHSPLSLCIYLFSTFLSVPLLSPLLPISLFNHPSLLVSPLSYIQRKKSVFVCVCARGRACECVRAWGDPKFFMG